MPDETTRLKLGKGVAFVKTRLRALPLNDDIWEADFGILDDGVIWLGLVVCPTSGAIFASEICDHSPDVNDLANLLAHAMRRPSIGNSRRPARIRLHDNSMWDELIPHLHELGIEVEAAKRLKSYQSAMQEFRNELRKDQPTAEAPSGDMDNLYPTVAQWVKGCGWIEIGDQEGLGFTVKALDLGGVVFEDAECRSLAEALASLESGLVVAMKQRGIN